MLIIPFAIDSLSMCIFMLILLFVCGWSDCWCFPAERFQNDLLELYEEPTIEEMEAALREMEEEEEEEEGSLEFIQEDIGGDDDAETENEQNRKRKLQEESPKDSQRKKM